MAGTMSGGISMQGLGSGTDFSEMISKLKQYESIPKMRMEIWKAEWETRIDAFQAITTKMSELKTALADFNNLDKMLAREVSSSKSEYATATANSQIDEGVYSIDVTKMANAAMFSSKKVYAAKTDKVNTTGANQTFRYTYKGTTRTIDIPDGYTLEQMVTKINQDSRNPGVKASIMRNGSGYVFQIQGKDTGASNTLNIESSLADFDASPHFSPVDTVVNNTGSTQKFNYSYGSKTHSVDVTDGMTFGQLVDKINAQSGTTGLSASMKFNGSNASLEFRDTRTNVVLSGVTTSSNLQNLGAQKTDWTSTDVVNNTGNDQAFAFNVNGKAYSVNVADGTTVAQLESQINTYLSGMTGGDVRKPQVSFASGEMKFYNTNDAELTSTDSNPMVYKYQIDGVEKTIDMPAGSTIQDLVGKINEELPEGMKASVDDNGGNLYVKFTDSRSGSDVDYTDSAFVLGGSNITGMDTTANAGINPGAGVSAAFTTRTDMQGLGGRSDISAEDIVVNSGAAENLTIITDSGTYTFNVASGMTLGELVEDFNNYAKQPGNDWDLRMELKSTGSGYEIAYTKEDGTAITPTSIQNGSMTSLRGAASNYNGRQAQNAEFTMNGWDQVFSSETNRLTEVVEGLDITLKGIGETNLTVTNDKEAIKDNIQEIVDNINGLMAQITELTKYNEDKDTKSPEVDDETGLMKMASQFTWQKGSILQGNYGVQLLRTRLRYLNTNTAKGFVPKASKEDTLNDSFATLAAIGITTNSKESDDSFGMLIIDEDKLDKALEEDLRGVVELFSANKQPFTDSTEFTVASVSARAKPGNYDVTYEVGADGRPDPDTVYINGAKAAATGDGRFTVADYNNDLGGVAIQFTEANLGAPGTKYSNSLRIKDGKVNEFIRQLEEELEPVLKNQSLEDKMTNGYKAGALPSLIDNYQNVIANINKKIERETSRLATWEKRQKAKYARLDTSLANYYNQMEKNEASLGQLSNGK